MQPLEKSLRTQLGNTVKEARKTAEIAAQSALQQLGVEESVVPNYLSEQERDLRRRLRIHGRQLGDIRDSKTERQEINRLIEEVAYEHWHRMLFARFLAANQLLMYPDPDDPVAVTLEECEDLATDEGAKNGWELAARYAAGMLPQIFRLDSPVFQLVLPPEFQQKLEALLADLPEDVFLASDALGWVYQFWQANNKERINKSEVKIGARELPAVTQLFTEPYMVSFLLDNTLGAWWAGQRLTTEDWQNAGSEAELRAKVALPDVSFDYLRFVQQEGVWSPAAGMFTGWPQDLSQLKVLDPCCGSGHFLVGVFLMLVPLRMEREGLTAREAVDRVLAENIHGLELDQRCVELAAFALALTAWRFPGAGGYRPLPGFNLACSGLAVSAAKEEWKQLALGKQNLRIALDWLYQVFEDAPTLGSLLNPAKSSAANLVSWDELSGILTQALAQESTEEQYEAGVVAQGIAKAATLLADKYTWVVTNVPYLARGKQGETLRAFCDQYYPNAKSNLATVFLERCLELCQENGTTSLVIIQDWLFLTTYKQLRENLLKNNTWHLIARLGSWAFETIIGEVVQAILITISKEELKSTSTLWSNQNLKQNLIKGIDLPESRIINDKINQLLTYKIKQVEQIKQLDNPDTRVVFDDIYGDLLKKYVSSYQGIKTGDDLARRRFFWEQKHCVQWVPLLSTVDDTKYYGGRESVINWQSQGSQMARLQGISAWNKKGIAVSQMSRLPVAIFNGNKFDSNISALPIHNPIHLPAIWCFCSSPEYNEAVRQIDQSLKVTNATLVKVPFDLEYWTKIAEKKNPNGLPQPYSDDPTQWIFHGHPCGSVIWDETTKTTAQGTLRTDHTVLQIAVARLLGYRWPAELDSTMELAPEVRHWIKQAQTLDFYSDQDGIVCIPPVRGEMAASEQLLNLLAAAYGKDWNTDKLSQLLTSADHAGKTLDTWLREKFFSQHCKLFQHRPFIWHIWDGLRDGFAALVNYHKLDYKLLETLTYTYLGDWIARQKQDQNNGIDGAVEKLTAAENLKKRLELILQGEQPYDIFVRWKPLEQQAIGWNPDLNDGVRLNIRPFLSVPDVGKKGAGVLRDKPNINWNKDRGKDVESAPWFKVFNGDRINDYHLSIEEKQKAREISHE
jgi:hypothetical protein